MATWKKVIVSGSDAELNSLKVTNGITGSLRGTASYADSSSITYITSSGNVGLKEIEVADFDANVAVTYVNGRLKFIFGTPVAPNSIAFNDGGTFLTDRFSGPSQTDNYTVTANWNNQGYTFVEARIYTGSTLLNSTTTANSTTINYNTTTALAQNYRFELTASSPLDNSIYTSNTPLSLNLSKVNPAVPTATYTPTVQLGVNATTNIEQGATGSIVFQSTVGLANSWTLLGNVGTGSFGSTINLFSGTSSPNSATFFVTGSATGSTSIVLTANTYYNSNGLASPEVTSTQTATRTYTKIRSVRYGTIATAALAGITQAWLENLANWDTTLGGTVGTIVLGTQNVGTSGYTCPALTTSGNHFIFVVNSSFPLAAITNTGANLNDIANFTAVTVGNYRVYYSTNPSAATITYKLST